VTVLSVPALEQFNPVLGRLRPASRPEADLQAVLDHVPARAGTNRVFTRLEWGDYLDWAGHPRMSPFMDGRIEIYPNDVWRQYHAVTSGREDWQAILDRRGVDYLLLDESFHAELLPRVRASGRWAPVARSEPAVLFGRTDGTAAGTTDIQDAR
jgi:hypothetical protein